MTTQRTAEGVELTTESTHGVRMVSSINGVGKTGQLNGKDSNGTTLSHQAQK